jgi:acetyl-CoA carboxylase carboxyl transferase subunit alpha
MFENAVYSVISPEGCAAILWKSASAKDRAAEALKLTALDLAGLGVVDQVLPEPLGGAHEDWDAAAATLKDSLVQHVDELSALEPDERRQLRWAKFEQMGEWREDPPTRAGAAAGD